MKSARASARGILLKSGKPPLRGSVVEHTELTHKLLGAGVGVGDGAGPGREWEIHPEA